MREAHTFELFVTRREDAGASSGYTTKRRDADCGKRDSRNVEGQQDHETGGTIDADGMRPLHKKHAVRADDPQLARTRPL